MTVSVTFLGALRRLAGHRQAHVTLDAGATVADLVGALARTYGRAFSDAVFRAPGELQTSLRVFLDEREAVPTERVVSTDRVALLVIQGFEGGAT